MARLSLSLLGPFQVTLDEKPVTDFESDRIRALLAYLAVEADRPHRREALAGLLWPNWPDRSALANLRNALSSLRKAIGDRKTSSPVLLVNRETIQFNSASDSWVDVRAFRALTEAGKSADCLEEGIGLYRGPLLEGFGLKDSVLFEEWAQVVREQLHRQSLTTLEQLAEHYEQHGDLDRACEHAWRQVDLAPWKEEAHQRLMRLLALSGQRSAAMAQYEACRRLLQQELGVEPSPETRALYERIRDGEIGEQEEAAGPPVLLSGQPRQPSLPKQSSLPVWLTPFVGREDILAEIHDRLRDPTCRLLILVGPGGSGKTRLAVEAAAGLATAFSHGVHFVSLAPLQSVEAIVPTVAHVLGFSFQDEENPLQQLLSHLRQKTMLLVLDNFEHLLAGLDSRQEDSGGIVAEILQAAPGVKVLITSHTGLNLQGEYLLPVPGMRYPEQPPASLSDALQYGAVQLFLQSARRVRPDFDPTEDDLAQVIQICRLVQGMPLGLLLAAAWMRMLSPAEIAARIAKHSLDFLEAEWRDVPERQRSMRAVFDYSWRLLSAREQQVLAGLSVFRGGLAYPAARQVATVQGTAATLRELLALVNSSLLQRTPMGRYEMHELLRQYAEEKLHASPDGDQATRDRHAGYYAAALRRWAAELQGPREKEALAEMDIENDNVQAAWAWAVEHGQVERLAEGMEGLGLFYDWRARYQEGEMAFRVLADAPAADDSSEPVEPLKVWASALAWQARFHQRLGQAETARERAHQSLAVLEDLTLDGQDVRRQRALALQILGEIELQLGNCQNGKEPLGQSLSLYRALGDRRSTAYCLRSLGRLVERMGNYGDAAQLHQESVEICRALGAQRDTVEALLDLFVDLQFLGRYQESERLLWESLAIAQQLEDRAALTEVRYRLAMFLKDSKPTESLALLEECVAVYAELGDRHRWALALMRLGEAKMYQGQYDQAHAALEESLAWYREVDNRWGIGAALWLFAELAQVEGQHEAAWQFSQESVIAFRRSGARADVGMALVGLGMAAAGSGDLGQARHNLADALRVALKYRHDFASTHVLVGAALLAAEERNGARAVELWALASQAPMIAASRIYQDLYGKRIAAVAETLPPDVVAVAEERGRAKDMWAALEELLAELGG